MKERSASETIFMIFGAVFGIITWLVRFLMSLIKGLLASSSGSKSTASSRPTVPTGAETPEVTAEALAANADSTTSASDLVEDVKARTATVADTAAASDVADKGAHLLEEAKDKAHDLLEDVKQKFEEKKAERDAQTDGGEDLQEKGTHLLDDAREKGTHLLDDVKDKGAHLLGEAKGAIETARGKMADASDDVKEKVDSASDVSDSGDGDEFESITDQSFIEEGTDLTTSLFGEAGREDLATQQHEDIGGVPTSYGAAESGDIPGDGELFSDVEPVEEEGFLADEGTTLDDIPAASRGFAFEDEVEIEGEPFSTTGGVVDILNDESDEDDGATMSVVDDPDAPVSADEIGGTTYEDDPTLGLREADFSGADQSAIGMGEEILGDVEPMTLDDPDHHYALEPEPLEPESLDDDVSDEVLYRDVSDVASQDDFDHHYVPSGTTTAARGGGLDAVQYGSGPDTDRGTFWDDNPDETVTERADESAFEQLEDVSTGPGEGDPNPDVSEPGGSAATEDATPGAPVEETLETIDEIDTTDDRSYITGHEGESEGSSTEEIPSESPRHSAAWATSAGVINSTPEMPDSDIADESASEESDTNTRQDDASRDSRASEASRSGGSGHFEPTMGDGAGYSTGGSGHFEPTMGDGAGHSTGGSGHFEPTMGDGAGYSTYSDYKLSQKPTDTPSDEASRVETPSETAPMGKDETTRKSTEGSSGGKRTPEGSVRGDGTASCPAAYPIKGNASSRIYHMPEDSSYEGTIPEFCFESEAAAKAAGFRPRKR